jgi:hypothetical protein
MWLFLSSFGVLTLIEVGNPPSHKQFRFIVCAPISYISCNSLGNTPHEVWLLFCSSFCTTTWLFNGRSDVPIVRSLYACRVETLRNLKRDILIRLEYFMATKSDGIFSGDQPRKSVEFQCSGGRFCRHVPLMTETVSITTHHSLIMFLAPCNVTYHRLMTETVSVSMWYDTTSPHDEYTDSLRNVEFLFLIDEDDSLRIFYHDILIYYEAHPIKVNLAWAEASLL